MAQALTERAAVDPAFAARVRESAGRVLALKERFGLLRC
jgi:beta-N-acetylhexosaminidase